MSNSSRLLHSSSLLEREERTDQKVLAWKKNPNETTATTAQSNRGPGTINSVNRTQTGLLWSVSLRPHEGRIVREAALLHIAMRWRHHDRPNEPRPPCASLCPRCQQDVRWVTVESCGSHCVCLTSLWRKETSRACIFFDILVLFRYTGKVFVHLSCTWVLICCVFVFGTRGKPEWDSCLDSTNWPMKRILIVVLDLMLILILIPILTNNWNPNQATTKTFSSLCCPNNF